MGFIPNASSRALHASLSDESAVSASMQPPRLKDESEERQPKVTRRTELVLAELGFSNRLDQANELVADSRVARQAEERWVGGTEIDIAEVAERELERREHFVLGVRMLAGREVLQLLRQGPALIAWRDVANFKFAIAKWTVALLHDC
jgi:hypothetical protein